MGGYPGIVYRPSPRLEFWGVKWPVAEAVDPQMPAPIAFFLTFRDIRGKTPLIDGVTHIVPMITFPPLIKHPSLPRPPGSPAPTG